MKTVVLNNPSLMSPRAHASRTKVCQFSCGVGQNFDLLFQFLLRGKSIYSEVNIIYLEVKIYVEVKTSESKKTK